MEKSQFNQLRDDLDRTRHDLAAQLRAARDLERTDQRDTDAPEPTSPGQQLIARLIDPSSRGRGRTTRTRSWTKEVNEENGRTSTSESYTEVETTYYEW